MRISRPILLVIVALALTAYAVDCSAMTTPADAMQCCKSMPCSSSSGHSQNCCKTMPAMHAPFVQAPSAQGFSPISTVTAILPQQNGTPVIAFSIMPIGGHSHAPPGPWISPSLPLRI
ncbi:MAG: hypothetical protein ACRD4S_07365 [Candidatus Acidiferrales bacterium]